MASSVTTVLVAKNGGAELDSTLQALSEQTIKPARVIVLTLGENPKLLKQLQERHVENVIKTDARINYGEALKFATEAAPELPKQSLSDEEWLWFLTEDSAPEKDALKLLTRAMARSDMVAVAGPKLINWHDEKLIIELGQGLTTMGARWTLDSQELDQQQYDHFEDVMGVGPVGMLVKRRVWEELGGFDPALPVYDDGLDFSVRARLAGYRVRVVPEARVRFAQNGVGGPKINRKYSVMRAAHRQALESSYHRRLSYAKSPIWFFMWLALPVVGVLGMLWALVRGRPGTVLGELWAALKVFFNPQTIIRSRRQIRKINRAGFQAIKPLRTDLKTVRTQRMIRKEAILAAEGRSKQELHFISTGGLALTLVMAVVSVALTWWLLGASFVDGGGAGPLSGIKDLWSNTRGEFFQDPLSLAGYATARPADPLSWVFAIFGTMTFWNPSLAVVLLFLFAVPLASLGGWMWGAKLSEDKAARVLSGVLWGAGPMLLAAMSSGRINSIILAVVLPWVLVALSNSHKTWSWAATSSLLAALALSTSPILIPGAAVLLVVAIIVRPKSAPRFLLISLAPIILFIPVALRALATGNLFDIFIDPGVVQPYNPATPWQMFLGFPTLGMSGWAEILTGLQIPVGTFTLVTGFALLPLGLLAVAGLFAGHPRLTAIMGLTGALGLVTALVSPALQLSPAGSSLAQVWAGSGLALYWVAITTLAVFGVRILMRYGTAAVTVALIGVAIVVAPSLMSLATNNVAVSANERQLPAVALAKATSNPESRTLFLSSLSEDQVRAEVVVGESLNLDQRRTADLNAPVREDEHLRAELVGALLSSDSDAVENYLAEASINFIVLRPSDSPEGVPLHGRLQAAFDQQTGLEAVGQTSKGMLWRTVTPSEGKTEVTEWLHSKLIWGVQLSVLIGLLLLALPTAEVRERPPRIKRGRLRTRVPRARTVVKAAVPTSTPAAETTHQNPRVGEESFDEIGLAQPETGEHFFEDAEVNDAQSKET